MKSLDFVFVGEVVVECDDVGCVVEMFGEVNDVVEGDLCEFVDRGFVVVEFFVWNVVEEDVDEFVYIVGLCVDGDGCDLFVVVDDDCLVVEVEGE